MMPAHVVRIETPKKYLLNGLWFGPKKPKRVVVWVHGLGSSLFSKLEIFKLLADKQTAVLAFNNRGHDKVSRLARVNEKKIDKTILAGAAHEVFTDCVDDIEGAVQFAKKQSRNVYLAGHSTGCQKAVYWASKRAGGRAVKGIVLLAPVSDWAAGTKLQGKRRLARTERIARALVKQGKSRMLLPEGAWHEVLDAQRFLSLYTPDSAEEIFPYAQSKKTPRALKLVKQPVLVLWAENEEFSALPAPKVQDWFAEQLKIGDTIVIVPRTGHLFKGGEKRVVSEVRKFMLSA